MDFLSDFEKKIFALSLWWVLGFITLDIVKQGVSCYEIYQKYNSSVVTPEVVK